VRLCCTSLPDQFPERAGHAFGDELIAARVWMNLVALERRIGQDSGENLRNEQASLLARHSFIHLFVIRVEARKAKSEEDDHGVGVMDFVNDGAQVRLGRRDRHTAKKVVAAEAGDDDARVAREHVGVEARERGIRRIATHTGIDDRRADQDRQPRRIVLTC